MSFGDCEHFHQMEKTINLENPETTEGCFECLKIGGRWVHLRQCMIDGKVRCCDSSPNRHASAHYEQSGHPVIYLLENDLYWCYVDDLVKKNDNQS